MGTQSTWGLITRKIEPKNQKEPDSSAVLHTQSTYLNPFPSTCILRALSRTPETTRRSPLQPHPRLCKDSPQTLHPPHLHFFQTTHMSTFHQTSVRAVFPRLRLASSNRIPLLRP